MKKHQNCFTKVDSDSAVAQDSVSIIAEIMPEFVGGADSLKSFMKNNFAYTKVARDIPKVSRFLKKSC